MPKETQQAVQWALQQEGVVHDNLIDSHSLVDAVRDYFNGNNIEYGMFSAKELEPYLA